MTDAERIERLERCLVKIFKRLNDRFDERYYKELWDIVKELKKAKDDSA